MDGPLRTEEQRPGRQNNRRVERKAGRVPKLAGGASHSMTLDIGIHVSKSAVEEVTRRIAAIQGSSKPIIDQEPKQ